MTSLFRPAIVLFVLLTLVCGVLYPLAVTGVGRVAFPAQANGSLIRHHGKLVGSRLIGQPFGSPVYFWARPSATSPMPNNASASGGSNLGPSNPALVDAIKARIYALKQADPDNQAAIPVDLVTASASGLDPDISPAAADYQVNRIARERHMPADKLRQLIAAHTTPQYLGFFGEARVNVLELNLALDELK